VISQFATALLQNRSPTIYGDGEQTRDFTFVANVVEGVLQACVSPAANGEIFNIATSGRISLNELFETMKSIVGAGVEPIYADARRGDVRHSQADISKARTLLGYEPHVSFDDGLKLTIEWYRTAAPLPAR
jgi:nucleoside-diphosphate-sugar epimerase